jgi:hypothetical protein
LPLPWLLPVCVVELPRIEVEGREPPENRCQPPWFSFSFDWF